MLASHIPKRRQRQKKRSYQAKRFFLAVIPKDARIFWLKFWHKLETLNEKSTPKQEKSNYLVGI